MMFRTTDEDRHYVKRVEETNTDFRQKYSVAMGNDSLADLVPGLTPDDVKPDTEGETYMIEADPAINPTAKQPRMFTLDQMQDLFNVLLRRSHLRTRVGSTEDRISALEA